MAVGTVVGDAVAPHLLLLREDISVAGNHIEVLRLVVVSLVGREVVAVGIPYLAVCEEAGQFGVGVVDCRVALHIVVGAVNLHILHANYVVRVGIVVASLRLHNVVILHQNSSSKVFANLVGGVEGEVIGVEQRIAIHHLDDGRVYLGNVAYAIVNGRVTIDIYRVLIDYHSAEEADA